MSLSKLADQYPDFDLFHLSALELYHAINKNNVEYLLDANGTILFGLTIRENKLLHFTNFTFAHWNTSLSKFNQQLTFWMVYAHSESLTTCKIFTYKNKKTVSILDDEIILWAEALSPTKVLLQLAIDNNTPSQGSQIAIYDLVHNKLQNITSTTVKSTTYRDSALVVHQISGMEYLFSVLVDIQLMPEDMGDIEIYKLYNNNGEALVTFDTTIGQNGERTWFEPGKRGLGITYRLLQKTISFDSSWYHHDYRVCNALIDIHGNFYGDFYYVSGQIPSDLGKTSTRHPKYTDKKLLCLSLPDENRKVPLLTIFDENNTLIQTKYECPWLFFNYSNAIIKDKSLFGQTVLLGIDENHFVRLIDLNGIELENIEPIKMTSLSVSYAKFFIAQAQK